MGQAQKKGRKPSLKASRKYVVVWRLKLEMTCSSAPPFATLEISQKNSRGSPAWISMDPGAEMP